MRVDCSEPECSTCFHYRNSGIRHTHQEPEPNNVIAASSLSSQPVHRHLLHDDFAPQDPAVIAYISKLSSPIHSSTSPITTGKLTNQNQDRNTSVHNSTAPPTQPLKPASYGFTAFSGSKPPRSGSVQASTSFSLGTPQDFAKTASASGSRPDQRYHGYAPRQDGREMLDSIAASYAYRNKIHEKSRWEDYKQGDKGGWFPPLGSRPNATFSRSIPDHPQMRDFERRGGNMTASAFSSKMFPSSSSSAIFISNPHIRSSSQGSKYHGYVPKPDGRNMIDSISASNPYGHKSHDRWEDYKHGDKGGLRPNAGISCSGGLRPNAGISCSGGGLRPDGPRHGNMSGFGSVSAGVTTSSSSSSVLGQTNAPFTGFTPTLFPSSSSSPYSTTFPAPASSSVQRPRETVVGSSSTSSCRTACGAATTTTNSASQGTTTATHDNPTLLGTNLAAQGTTPGLQANPTMSGSNINAQGTTTPTFQAYPMILGSTLGAQGTTPSLLAYPIMFGTNLTAQGTNPATQGTNPALQAYPMMFGTNLAAQGTTPAIPAYYPVHGYILLPFATMSLQ